MLEVKTISENQNLFLRSFFFKDNLSPAIPLRLENSSGSDYTLSHAGTLLHIAFRFKFRGVLLNELSSRARV